MPKRLAPTELGLDVLEVLVARRNATFCPLSDALPLHLEQFQLLLGAAAHVVLVHDSDLPADWDARREAALAAAAV